jgi:FAD/FMN-containing dehydrogenase
MREGAYGSWGRVSPRAHEALRPRARGESLPRAANERGWLAYGNGRSYGDCCVNDGGVLIDTRSLDRFIAFDAASGVLECEAGVLLSDILQTFVPRGWFLPVTPGTQLVTVGGAIANDVHGKNHHVAGTFGRHVERLALARSDGTRLVCSASANAPLFRATIAGLGLTGLIESAAIRLRRIPSPYVDAESIRFDTLDEFFALAEESDRAFEYTVAWVDCAAPRGRGHFLRANHVRSDRAPVVQRTRTIGFPFDPPFSLVNAFTIRPFNALYFHRQRRRFVRRVVHYRPFFYPLDAIGDWNRVYGGRGFFQFQCVVPHADAPDAMAALLDALRTSRQGSFLAVLKRFGDARSPGMLSFPRPGVTLAIDIPNAGEPTRTLLARMEAIAMDAGGALYPAKDACMSPQTFRRSFAALEEFRAYVDPGCSSTFWRRVAG